MSKTLTRADLAQAVHLTIGLSRNDSAQLVETMLEDISRTLEKGEQVKLSSFGSRHGHLRSPLSCRSSCRESDPACL